MYEVKSKEYNVLKKGKHTFTIYSFFLPKSVVTDVFDLYAFLVVADEIVDRPVQDRELFKNFEREYITGKTDNRYIQNFLRIEKKYNFSKKWVQEFFKSMKMDFVKKTYETMEELDEYIYGASEITGLYIHKMLNFPASSISYSKKLGKSLHYLNIIRDISYDKEVLGREYIPQEYLRKFNLPNLESTTIQNNKENFSKLINFVLDIYDKAQMDAEKGYRYIPKKYLIAIKSAADVYKLTAKKIRRNPLRILQERVRPNRFELIKILIANIFYKPK